MVVWIDESRCVGCGFCMDAYPKAFGLGEKYGYIKDSFYTDDSMTEAEKKEMIKDANLLCAARAIILRDY